MIKTNFLGDKIRKENVHYTCITFDSVMKMKKMNYPQVYFEDCKWKIRKIKMPKFINSELSQSQSRCQILTLTLN